jgi:hypothetical protein
MAAAMNRAAEEHETLWILAASPTIWAVHLLLSYATGALWCGMVVGPNGSLFTARVAIAAYTLVALAAIGVIGWIGFRRHRLGSSEPPHDADTPEDRHRFLGYSTFLLSGISAVAVIYATLAVVFIEACQ